MIGQVGVSYAHEFSKVQSPIWHTRSKFSVYSNREWSLVSSFHDFVVFVYVPIFNIKLIKWNNYKSAKSSFYFTYSLFCVLNPCFKNRISIECTVNINFWEKNIGPKKNHGSMMKGDNLQSSEKTSVYKSQVHRQRETI